MSAKPEMMRAQRSAEAMIARAGLGLETAMSSQRRRAFNGGNAYWIESPDANNSWDRAEVVRASRSIHRVSQEHRAAIRGIVRYVVGNGLLPVGNTDAARVTARAFTRAVEGGRELCERGLDAFSTLQRRYLEAQFVDGDVLVVRTRYGTLSTVTGDRIGAVTMRGRASVETLPGGHRETEGVEVDARGRVVAFHASPGYVGAGAVQETPVRVEARHCSYLALRDTIGELRGRPMLGPSHEDLNSYDAALGAAGQQSVIGALLSYYTATRSPTGTAGLMPGDEDASASLAGGDASRAGVTTRRERVDGTDLSVLHLREGDEIRGVTQVQPSASLEKLSQLVVRRMCAMLGFPAEAIMSDFSRANFSVSRMAVGQAMAAAAPIREELLSTLCRPVFRWWVARERVAGRLPMPEPGTPPGADPALDVAWPTPPAPSVDPIKDSNADEADLAGGRVEYAEVLARRGTNLERIIDDRLETARRFAEAGLAPPSWMVGATFAPEAAVVVRDAEETQDEQDEQSSAAGGAS